MHADPLSSFKYCSIIQTTLKKKNMHTKWTYHQELASITTWAKEKNMAKAIRKSLEDIALRAVPKATPGLNIPVDFWRGKKGADVYCLSDNFQAYKPTSLNNRSIRGSLKFTVIDCTSPP